MHGIIIGKAKELLVRSFRSSFIRYMAGKDWVKENYRFEEFFLQWKEESLKNDKWHKLIAEELKTQATFFAEVIGAYEETVSGIFTEQPTKRQERTISSLSEKLRQEPTSCFCMEHASYMIAKLKKKLFELEKTKPADKKDLEYASKLYRYVYNQGLPKRNYRNEDIQFITDELKKIIFRTIDVHFNDPFKNYETVH
ncbi:hypothetical protein [Falsibacillus albus]|uniref:Uncharacterized protein n=1 Tax=Falsibacillus albus TaxID=2478915 RepID=A0A3L7K260_9BACI|nr:hypothetical protein [Falsibacillus albus]RLQ94772.1 hypothetical protein D9X91_12315 [Falsibacillus albus]